ncbi:MAG: sigma-70 family RNA polymerase sigma factor [Solirubrobacteraceae bacterium]
MEAFALSPDAPRVPLPQRLLSDERLLRLIAAGNSQAFGAVYARYHAPLYAYCRSIVRDPDDARDALQNTMLKALSALNRGQERDLTLKPWLFRIAHNESISLLRRRRPSEPLTDAVSPPVAGADRQAFARERLAQLVADLQELPERQRGALIMREVNGLSYDEIADALAISQGAARQTVFEARTALAEYGEGREVACENIRRSISDGDGRALRARRVRAHLRACNGCRDFQSTLQVRRRELAVLAPGLSAGSVIALLQGVLGAGVAGTAVGGATIGGAGLLGGSAGTLLASGAAKGVVAIVAVTAAGAGAVEIKHQASRESRTPAPQVRSAGPAASAAAAVRPGPAGREAVAMIRSAGREPARALAPLTETTHPARGNHPAPSTQTGHVRHRERDRPDHREVASLGVSDQGRTRQGYDQDHDHASVDRPVRGDDGTRPMRDSQTRPRREGGGERTDGASYGGYDPPVTDDTTATGEQPAQETAPADDQQPVVSHQPWRPARDRPLPAPAPPVVQEAPVIEEAPAPVDAAPVADAS